MLEFLNIFWESTLGVFVFYKQNLFFESPWSQNYLWGLVLISLLVISAADLDFPFSAQPRDLKA